MTTEGDQGWWNKRKLTQRQIAVLRGLASGLTSTEIAADLGTTVHGVEAHVSAILAKTGVRNRTEAALYALVWGFIDLSDAVERAGFLTRDDPTTGGNQ